MKGTRAASHGALSVSMKRSPLLRDPRVHVVTDAHPPRQRLHVDVWRDAHREDADALLPREPPLLPHILGGDGGGRDHQHHVLDALDGVHDLLPPVASTLELRQVLPDREPVLPLQPLSQRSAVLHSVASRVGYEDARAGSRRGHSSAGPCRGPCEDIPWTIAVPGISASLDRRFVYAAEMIRRRVRSFERDAGSGALRPHRTHAVPIGPDNIDVAPDGTLWIGGHPNVFDLIAYSRDASLYTAAQVVTLDPVTGASDSVLVDRSGAISASSVGVLAGNTLVVGSALHAHVLICPFPMARSRDRAAALVPSHRLHVDARASGDRLPRGRPRGSRPMRSARACAAKSPAMDGVRAVSGSIREGAAGLCPSSREPSPLGFHSIHGVA